MMRQGYRFHVAVRMLACCLCAAFNKLIKTRKENP